VLTLEPDDRGPTEPLRSVPARRPGSVRRTSTIDTTWPDGLAGRMDVDGRARDLRTAADGSTEVVTEVRMALDVGPDRSITAIDAPFDGIESLVGTSTFRGFRTVVAATVPELPTSASPVRLLVDDLPGALLVSGMALLTESDLLRSRSRQGGMALDAQVDICAGWASDGGMVRFAREHGYTPTPVVVPSRSLEPDDDPLAWHDAPLPAPVATRRRRLLDVAGDGASLRVSARFRDSLVGTDGVEQSFHEYAVDALVDRGARTVTAIVARPGVLPWTECPQALASAGRLVGTSIDDLRAQVRADFRGTTTCTHLNDVLAAIGDTPVLLDLL